MAKVSSSGPDFTNLLKQKPSEAPRPVSCPAGVYHAVLGKQSFGKNRFEPNINTVRYEVKLTAPTEAINQDELVGADGQPIDLSKVRLIKEFDITSERLYILNDFFESLGLDPSKPLEELIPEAVGAAVLAEVTAKASEDGKDFFNNVKKVVGA